MKMDNIDPVLLDELADGFRMSSDVFTVHVQEIQLQHILHQAIQQFDGHELKGRPIKVSEARARKGGGGGRGRRE